MNWFLTYYVNRPRALSSAIVQLCTTAHFSNCRTARCSETGFAHGNGRVAELETLSLTIECRRIDPENLGDFFERFVAGDQMSDVFGLDLFEGKLAAKVYL